MSLRVGHIIPDILLSDLGFVPGEVMKLFKKVVVFVFLYSAGPTIHHCMDYRFEPTESRLQRGEVPSFDLVIILKNSN